jgi:hypothetical protein
MDVEAGDMEWLVITFELRHAQAIEALRDCPKVLDADSLESLASMLEASLHPRPDGPDALSISCTLARLLKRLLKAPAIAQDRRDNVRNALLESITNPYAPTSGRLFPSATSRPLWATRKAISEAFSKIASG